MVNGSAGCRLPDGQRASLNTGTDRPNRTDPLYETLAVACRILAGEGLSRVSTGHVSARTADGNIAIRGRHSADAGLQFAAVEDILEMTPDGEVLGPPGISPPRECHIHLAVLQRRPEVQSVVHVHPRSVIALSAAGVPFAPIYGAYDPEGLRLAAGDIAYFPSSRLIDTVDLGREVAETLGDLACCVLHGHGIVTVGASIEAAVLTAIAMDELARVTWMAAAVGRPQSITPLDLEALDPVVQALRGEGLPMAGSPSPTVSGWQHWVERDRSSRRDRS